MVRYLFILLLLLGPLFSAAQNTTVAVSGKVTDITSGQPLNGISVYINNTTYSTQTEKDGTFLLGNIPLQTFELTFSAINYETLVMSLDTQTVMKSLDIRLKQNAVTLNEVVVSGISANGWAQYGTTFTRDFLSYSPFSKNCEIVNPHVIRFRNNKKDNILKAYATEPLKIKNKALGYELTYWLEEYEHRFLQQIVQFKGYTQFAEMQGSKKKQNLWNKNRNTAYRGSLMHFLRSVYKGTTAEEGFIVNLIKTISYKDLELYLPVSSDTISQSLLTTYIAAILKNKPGADIKAQNLKTIQWLKNDHSHAPLSMSLPSDNAIHSAYFFVKDTRPGDQVFVYRFDVKDQNRIPRIQWQTAGSVIPDNKTILKIDGYESISAEQKDNLKIKLFYKQPLKVSDFVIRKGKNVYFRFDDSWQVSYTKEDTEDAYITGNSLNKDSKAYQISVLSMAGQEPVVLYPDGYHIGTYSLVTGAYWSYEKTDKLLPLDFRPH
ncbi:MAG: carboxypeptidase-like regulatory domain-containing protein [Niabella sp.]